MQNLNKIKNLAEILNDEKMNKIFNINNKDANKIVKKIV
jgi:hypothetical protein